MLIATWNVNSIRARHERLVAFLERHTPDVVCLQELKCEAEVLEALNLESLGYQVAANCQKTYNGVAILSKRPIEDVAIGLGDGEDDPQARLVSATIDGVRVVSAYIPNGGEVGSDKYVYKLRWLERLRAWLDAHCDPTRPLALCGDFNVAPEARDVFDPAAMEGDTLFHADSRDRLQRILDWGLVDTFRLQHEDAGLYSWWDYRMLAFPKNRGFRIDLILATPSLASRVEGSSIDREERKGKQPSDHAPVLVKIA
ncbi:exodeoxyribonuclease III [Vulgatibacter incomptus]|uniref:Exodeoxyribonuclease III n=1 Tax=Vulgatibacter incomptus TaxID=1391653 RepID=A0A0K1PEU6_9BACT|nr:exodeoxyribonuclease III [Vulgatibacter incomptus]AKU92040.1 Exodeoxyribonuclease III [Vulgatibacter incomptus]